MKGRNNSEDLDKDRKITLKQIDTVWEGTHWIMWLKIGTSSGLL
jgi:hypothetical protein